MKIQLPLFVFLILFLGSCVQTSYYQLYKTQADYIKSKSNEFAFENSEVKITYDLWDNFGNSNFMIFNKTDKNIFLDLGKSHLIINGVAKTYFQNRIYTEFTSSNLSTQSGSGTSISQNQANTGSNSNGIFTTNYEFINTQTNSSSNDKVVYSNNQQSLTLGKGYSVSYSEQRIILIPALSGKIVQGFNLNTFIYRDCDLLRFPTANEIKSKSFTKENSPLIFKNIITYGFSEEEITKSVENNFWVTEITNYPYSSFVGKQFSEFCGKKSQYPTTFLLFSAPSNFYVKYNYGR